MAGVPFGPYLLQKRLAVGGMGEVFAVRLSTDGAPPQRFALKRMRPEVAQQPDFKPMFIDEVNVLLKVDHPHLVKLLDFGEIDGQLFLLMEYIDGASLLQLAMHREQTAGPPLSWPLVAHVGLLLCEALGYLHALEGPDGQNLGLLHRDLNPSNVLIGRNGALKVIDLGVARLKHRAQPPTEAGVVKGKPTYLAAEQVQGGPVDARTDLYALGLTMYRLLTGSLPFNATKLFDLLRQVVDLEVPPIRRLRADVPAPLEELIDALAAKQPALRPGSADECRRALVAALALSAEPVGTAELAGWVQHALGPPGRGDGLLTAPLTLVELGRLFLDPQAPARAPAPGAPAPMKSWWQKLRDP